MTAAVIGVTVSHLHLLCGPALSLALFPLRRASVFRREPEWAGRETPRLT